MIVESLPGEVTERVCAARRDGRIVGVVPTMGALHRGHVSLIERARQECGFVIVTIFVNPTQFLPGEDYTRYPRTLETDLLLCQNAGADLAFTPTTAAMYPAGTQTAVHVDELARCWEGQHRPGHFTGVATIVAKLLNLCLPDRAYFGQKDFQQQLIIQRMVSDLNFPVSVVVCPIVRESDGLALSSRNRYLSPDERRAATSLFRTLQLAESLAMDPSLTPPEISRRMQQNLQGIPEIRLSYATVADCQTLEPLTCRKEQGVALIAAHVGNTRLIDNQILQFRSEKGSGTNSAEHPSGHLAIGS